MHWLVVIPLLLSVVLGQCPDLDFGYGSYSATAIQNNTICFYQNVRFGTPPTGKLRFQRPQPPTKDDPKAPSGPVSCYRVDTSSPCVAGGGFLGGDNGTCIDYVATQQEDCLFLDLYVPLTVAQSGTATAPVVVWIYGGAYVYGSKDDFDLSKAPLYSGEGVIDTSTDSIIFVAGNYRTGAFGWLAGSYLEEHGQPNAGFLDQDLLLNWTSSYISKAGGDPNNINVWGESAGASSILHHLVAGQGKDEQFKPKFRRAITQSPAFEWLWNRTGTVNNTYTEFAGYANCPSGDMSCLQQQTEEQIQAANIKLFESTTACSGIFTVGPTLDGEIFTTLASLALAAGQFWKIDSLIVSHVSQEVLPGSAFIPLPIRKNPFNETFFENFLNDYFPGSGLASVRSAIDSKYPSSSYANQTARAAAVIQDSSFVCNPYYLAQAYNGITYAMDYDVFSSWDLAVHASDLLPAFWNSDWDYISTLKSCYPNVTSTEIAYIESFVPTFAGQYQAYFASHAAYGDPNKNETAGVTWPLSSADSNTFANILRPNTDHYFWDHWVVDSNDQVVSTDKCGFWAKMANQVVSPSSNSEKTERRIRDDADGDNMEL